MTVPEPLRGQGGPMMMTADGFRGVFLEMQSESADAMHSLFGGVLRLFNTMSLFHFRQVTAGGLAVRHAVRQESPRSGRNWWLGRWWAWLLSQPSLAPFAATRSLGTSDNSRASPLPSDRGELGKGIDLLGLGTTSDLF
jgi:hypothetical protein